MKGKGVIGLAISILLSACVEIEPVSPIPEITFTSLETGYALDSLGNYKLQAELIFDFIDGDADFGIYRQSIDSIEWNKNNYNLFLTPYYKVDSNYFLVEIDSTEKPPPWYHIFHNTRFDRVGQTRSIKGTITVGIIDPPIDYDTIRYEFYIKDREGNESNIEVSSDVGTQIEAQQVGL